MQTIDPVNNKEQIKASITNAITKLVTGSNRDEVALRVEETYERLLIDAAVFAHVPSLTAGSVRREVLANLHRRSQTGP
jgi:hypothetical protein